MPNTYPHVMRGSNTHRFKNEDNMSYAGYIYIGVPSIKKKKVESQCRSKRHS